MDEKNQTDPFSDLAKEAEMQVHEVLDRMRLLSAEAATEAARIAIKDAITEIKGVEQKMLQVFGDSNAAISTHLQDATDASRVATQDAVAKIKGVEQKILQVLGDAIAAASMHLQDATKKLGDAKRRIVVIEARIEEQGGLIRRVLTRLWVLALMILIILVVVLVR